MENVSPMLKQYLDMKKEIGAETLLFFRLGDFYELFYEDAQIVSKELELILTSRAAGNNQKAPMCGVPHHAAHSYIQRLVSKGYKVAIAQQMEDPATSKGLVHREVTKIITQGTNFDQDDLENSYLASVTSDLFNFYLTLYDITNNQLKKIQIDKDLSNLLTLLHQHHVKEVLIDDSSEKRWLEQNTDFILSEFEAKAKTPKDLSYQRLMDYLSYTQKQSFHPIETDQQNHVMKLDYVSLNNLELLSPQRANSKSLSLFNYLNKTNTSMGARNLKEWIKYPLLKKEDILSRQAKVSYLIEEYLIHHQLSELLKGVYDVTRLSTKIEYKTSTAPDLIRLKNSLIQYHTIKDLLENTAFSDVFGSLDAHDLINLISDLIQEEAPLTISSLETINPGVDEELDEYRDLVNHSNQWLLDYENKLKEETGIKNLKVGYSKQFGYYLEVSKGQIAQVKEEYGFIRRQTLTNAERYFTQELKELEEKILHASDRISEIETRLFNELVDNLQSYLPKTRQIGQQLSEIDSLSSLATISSQPGFVLPTFSEDRTLRLIDSKHPILYQTMKAHKVIANDLLLDDHQDIMILTGPNMGGKSTYMRQVAISVILAQMGCYVLAKEAHLPLFDAIYTRMGASDDILSGHSTFMIEMIEANQAIRNATKDSLILFDEIGRGTSTYDGMAIAGSIVEYLSKEVKARCIFSTHYHELVELAEKLDNVFNAQVSVQEKNQNITFLYQVKPGSANRSYGIHVAALADMPNEIIKTANEKLKTMSTIKNSQPTQIQEVNPSINKVSRRLNEIQIDSITGLEALRVLDELKKLNGEDDE